ncbi:MAG: SLC13 family permease [Stappiaceae bacterium]
MTQDQLLLFGIFAVVFIFLIWGRWRYDLVAFMALLVALLLGLVPNENAFSGFGHPATVIVALVLVVSRGLVNAGAVDIITRNLVDPGRSLGAHITAMGGIGGVLSAFMNNVAALALLMPVDMQTAKKAGRGPGITLMPLAFATILGGMVTLIGTPPNIIIAQFRERSLGEPFHMFDFAPVGLVAAITGMVFVSLIGWRLLPARLRQDAGDEGNFDLSDYIVELIVPEGSGLIGKRLKDLDELADDTDIAVLGIVRGKTRLPGRGRYEKIQARDVLILEAAPDGIDQLRTSLKLEIQGENRKGMAVTGEMGLVEVVVPRDASIEGRSALSMQLLRRHGVTLLGVSRHGRRFYERVRRLPIRAGDILLLYGRADQIAETVAHLGCLPLAQRGLGVTQQQKAGLAVGVFAAAIAISSFGFIYLPVALACVAAIYVITDIVPIRELYDQVEWPVVVLLGSMIPLGEALQGTGGTALIADGILTVTSGLPAYMVVLVLMVATMTLSDVLNNTATAIVGAPIAIDMAEKLNVNPDPFLMTVAVAASCAFLTPIGHKNNTLIMGPGGYKFGDYWRMGLPLEILIIAVSVPAILFFWPL